MGEDGGTAITVTVRQHFGNEETMKAKLSQKRISAGTKEKFRC